jgi:hypothetical protein
MSRESNGTDVRDTEIAKMRAAGVTQAKIAEHTGLSIPGVRYVLAKEQVQAMIEQEQSRLAALMPSAMDNYEHWVNKAKTFHDKTDKEIAFRATTKVLESHGLLPGNQSVVIQQFNTKNTIISPILEKVLEEYGKKLRPPEVIDVDFEEVNGDVV